MDPLTQTDVTVSIGGDATALGVTLVKTKAQINNLTKEVKKAQPPFAGYAMSIMFAGMQLKRMSQTLATFGISAFNDVMHSVEGTATSADMLTGAFKYLGFTIGQALEPVLAWLVPIVISISDWISQNQELVAMLLSLSWVLGTVLFVAGGLKLAFDGLYGTFIALSDVYAGIVAALTSPITLPIIGAAAATYIAWKTNLGDIQGLVSNTVDIMNTTFDSLGEDVKLMGSGVRKVFKGMLENDTKLTTEGMSDLMQGSVSFIIDLLYGLGATFANIGIWFGNVWKDAMYGTIYTIIYLIETTINALGKGISPVFDLVVGLMNGVDKLRKRFNLEPIFESTIDDLKRVKSETEKIGTTLTASWYEELRGSREDGGWLSHDAYLTADQVRKATTSLKDSLFMLTQTRGLKDLGLDPEKLSVFTDAIKNMKISNMDEMKSQWNTILELIQMAGFELKDWNTILAGLGMDNLEMIDSLMGSSARSTSKEVAPIYNIWLDYTLNNAAGNQYSEPDELARMIKQALERAQ